MRVSPNEGHAAVAAREAGAAEWSQFVSEIRERMENVDPATASLLEDLILHAQEHYFYKAAYAGACTTINQWMTLHFEGCNSRRKLTRTIALLVKERERDLLHVRSLGKTVDRAEDLVNHPIRLLWYRIRRKSPYTSRKESNE